MKRPKSLSFFGFFGCLVFLGARTAPNMEVHVNLLGQPCLIQGPFDDRTLRLIHDIGPAQAYPNIVPPGSVIMIRQANEAHDRIKKAKGLPSLLDSYRDKLTKRLEAQIALLNGLEKIKKQHNSAFLVTATRPYIHADRLEEFEALCKKLQATGFSGPKYRDALDQLFDYYNESIEPDPEPIFHRVIKRMNVQYKCSFEEAE